MRIEEHPILGVFEKGPKVHFTFDGKTMEGFAGEPIAIALRSNGVLIHRYTAKRNEPRACFVPLAVAPIVSWWWTACPIFGRVSNR